MTVFMSALTLVQTSKSILYLLKEIDALDSENVYWCCPLLNTVVFPINHEELIYNSNRYEQYETMINILFS